MKNSSNASKQAAMESKADSKGSLAYKGWRARGAWGGWSWALSFNSLLRFHELSYFLTVIVRHQLLHSIFLVQTYSALSKSQRTFICTNLFVTSNHQFIFTNLQICFNEISIEAGDRLRRSWFSISRDRFEYIASLGHIYTYPRSPSGTKIVTPQ